MYIEAIQTISSLSMFFLRKKFRAHKNTSHLEVYARLKNCCLCCLALAFFLVLLVDFCLWHVFVRAKFFPQKKKKKNRLEIVRIASIYNTTIITRNGKIVWKQGPYCWYFCLNLKYLGWPCRAYIKTAKNGNFWEELLSEKDFEAVVAIFCCYDHMPTLLRQFRRLLQTRKSITIAPRVL